MCSCGGFYTDNVLLYHFNSGISSIKMELTQIRQLPAVREVPMKSASADSKRFFHSPNVPKAEKYCLYFPLLELHG